MWTAEQKNQADSLLQAELDDKYEYIYIEYIYITCPRCILGLYLGLYVLEKSPAPDLI